MHNIRRPIGVSEAHKKIAFEIIFAAFPMHSHAPKVYLIQPLENKFDLSAPCAVVTANQRHPAAVPLALLRQRRLADKSQAKVHHVLKRGLDWRLLRF